MIPVRFFTRNSCPLCDAAEAELARAGIQYERIDVSLDPGLEAEYGTRVPVVEAAGREVFEAGMNPAQLAELASPAGREET